MGEETHVILRDPDGRFQKGVSANPNRGPLSAHLRGLIAKLKELDFDTVEHLVHLARNAKSEKVQVEACGYLINRQYPSLKSIELTGDAATTFALNIVKAGQENSKVIDGEAVEQKGDI